MYTKRDAYEPISPSELSEIVPSGLLLLNVELPMVPLLICWDLKSTNRSYRYLHCTQILDDLDTLERTAERVTGRGNVIQALHNVSPDHGGNLKRGR